MDWLQVVSSLGFPIVVCGWFMWLAPKFLDALNRNTQAIISLRNALEVY